VLKVLGGSPVPMPAQEVLDSLAGAKADRVTVYRTLNALVESGLAHRVDPGDRVWRYGILSHESDPPHAGHAHFVCDACGTVRCLQDATIRVQFKGRPEGEKFTVTQRDVYLHGTCEKCLEGE